MEEEYTTWTVTIKIPRNDCDWFYSQIDSPGQLDSVRALTEKDIEYRLNTAIKAAGRGFKVEAEITQDGD